MKKAILIIVLGLSSISNAQTWEFKTGTNSFDGKYSTASIKGTGTDYPYTNPVLVVNLFNDESLNFYVSQSGYFQNEKRMNILLILDENKDEFYEANIFSISKDGRTVFFREFIHLLSGKYIETFQFLEKLKNHNKIEIRISDDYGKNDIKFSLKGSSNAIDKVISESYRKVREQITQDFTEEIEERVRLAKERKERAKFERIRIDSLLLDFGFEEDEAIKTRIKIEDEIITKKYYLEAVSSITTEIGFGSLVQVNVFNKVSEKLFSIYVDAPEHSTFLKEDIKRQKRQKRINDSLTIERQIKETLNVANKKVLNIVERYQFEEETLNSILDELEKSYRKENYNVLNIEKVEIIKPYKDGKVLVKFYSSDDKWLFNLTEVNFPKEFERKLKINKPY